MAKANQASFTLAQKSKTYKGETYHELVGSFEKGGDTILITIQTDSNGAIKRYTSEKGTEFIYARAVAFKTVPKEQRRKNVLR